MTVAIGAKLGSLPCWGAHPLHLAGTISEQGALPSGASLVPAEGPPLLGPSAGGAELGLSWLRGKNISMATKPAPQRGSLASLFQATGGQPKPTRWRNWGIDQRLSLHQITGSPGPWAAVEPELGN